MITGLRLAAGFLTVLPVRPTEQITRPVARSAMLLGWLAVLPVGAVAALAGRGAMLAGLPPVVAGVVVVGLVALGTRAMHLDGLADTVDGLGSGPDRDKALRVMRSGDVGPMGVTALGLVLLVQAGCFGALLDAPWGWLQVAGLVAVSRAALAVGCRAGVPSARRDGLGALFAGVVPPVWLAVLWGAAAAGLAGLGWLTGQPWWQGVLAAVVALAAAWTLLARCVRRFGGMTGDVLGALVETVLTGLVLVSALQLG